MNFFLDVYDLVHEETERKKVLRWQISETLLGKLTDSTNKLDTERLHLAKKID